MLSSFFFGGFCCQLFDVCRRVILSTGREPLVILHRIRYGTVVVYLCRRPSNPSKLLEAFENIYQTDSLCCVLYRPL